MQESSLQYIAWEIDRMAEALELDEQVSVFAIQIVGNADRAGVDFVSLDRAAAASLYAACRIREAPVTLRDIVPVSRNSKKEIRAKAKTIADTLGLQLSLGDPSEIIRRDGHNLGLSPEQIDRVLTLAERAIEADFHINKAHSSISAAVLYASSVLEGWQYNQSDVCEVVGVTEVTVRKHYKKAFEAMVTREEILDKVRADCATLELFDDEVEAVLTVAEQALDRGYHLYDSVAAFSAGVVYVTGQVHGWPWSQNDVAQAVGVDKNIVGSRARLIRKDINKSTIPTVDGAPTQLSASSSEPTSDADENETSDETARLDIGGGDT